MHELIALIVAHKVISALVANYVVAAAIGSQDAPDANSSHFYRWWYKFSNTLAANLKRAYGTKLPNGLPNTAENAAALEQIAPPADKK